MPRWRALPDELDPQVREFVSQLRRLVDISGLSVAAIADRTGYSKTSWERYLNGRLLAPKRAVVTLAEVTGTHPVHLTTLWELAERAWSRSEMRHDMTMEAIRISQARAALGESGATATKKDNRIGEIRDAVPAVPQQSYAGEPDHPRAGKSAGSSSPDQQRRRRRLTMFLAGVVGALVVIAVAMYLTGGGLGGGEHGKAPVAKPKATPTSSASELPAGVKCTGKDCTGKDPEAMGCASDSARTTASVLVGPARVEVRYSEVCGAAWARITQATPGDTVRIQRPGGAGAQTGTVGPRLDAYTPMTAVAKAGEAQACAILKTGTAGCTR
ncbi:XRE family transcriptional regulator [Streptomyces sp. NPDC046821]|uniref:XRE family transcriptional regulator n=1 Tax=Streptomyces sp. NPDC046821 TaxID=3154702 RepID=UPI0033F66073